MFNHSGNKLQCSKDGRYVNFQRDDGQPVPKGSIRQAIFVTNGLIAKGARMSVPHSCMPAIFDPSTIVPMCVIPEGLVHKIEKPKYDEKDEAPIQNFTQVVRHESEDVFADFGLIEDDGDEVSEAASDQELSKTTEMPTKLPKPTSQIDDRVKDMRSPFERAWEALNIKQVEEFGISKDELTALLLTKRQIRNIYEGCLGSNPGNIEIGVLKQEIRKYANSSYANYTRAVSEIERVHKEFPAIRK